jgi:hypothetical protein
MSGQSMPRPGTMAYPPNLTPDPDTGLDGWSAMDIANAMRKGIDNQGFELCNTMPKFTDMKDDEAMAIAAYLQFLTATHHAIPESICPPIKNPPHDEDAGKDASDDGADSGDASLDAADAGD